VVHDDRPGAATAAEMRAAVLELAFAWLGADTAVSGALGENFASYAVSPELGYGQDVVEMHAVRGSRRCCFGYV
jgi:RimJ/RimL family protein N-acetyltransferase